MAGRYSSLAIGNEDLMRRIRCNRLVFPRASTARVATTYVRDAVRPTHRKHVVMTVEERLHNDMRKFKARIGGEFDPLDIDKFTAHWKQKRHLSPLPNETSYDPENPMSTGEWLQRLVETVEIYAVHIDKLNERIKALEAK